jgi:hypothetical protein
VFLVYSTSLAQSGTRVPASGTRGSLPESATKAVRPVLGMNGDCRLCIFEMKQWGKGSSEFTTMHKEMRERFPDEQPQRMFRVNPEKFEVQR